MSNPDVFCTTGQGFRPMACPHCDQRQLFLGAAHLHAMQSPFDLECSLTTGDANEVPADPTKPPAQPFFHVDFQCLSCLRWSRLALASSAEQGTWLFFKAIRTIDEGDS